MIRSLLITIFLVATCQAQTVTVHDAKWKCGAWVNPQFIRNSDGAVIVGMPTEKWKPADLSEGTGTGLHSADTRTQKAQASGGYAESRSFSQILSHSSIVRSKYWYQNNVQVNAAGYTSKGRAAATNYCKTQYKINGEHLQYDVAYTCKFLAHNPTGYDLDILLRATIGDNNLTFKWENPNWRVTGQLRSVSGAIIPIDLTFPPDAGPTTSRNYPMITVADDNVPFEVKVECHNPTPEWKNKGFVYARSVPGGPFGKTLSAVLELKREAVVGK
jgi:hypothetical protein